MAGLEETRMELGGQLTYLKLMLMGTWSLSKLLVTSAGDVKKLRQTRPSEDHYVRPPRRYELPPYTEGMKVCRSDEKYLRPTRGCNPRAPEVVALAHSLGAFQTSDYEFAQAAFGFAKEKMTLEILPLDGVEETLRRGTGTCFQLISVFIALCRAAGIKARYKERAKRSWTGDGSSLTSAPQRNARPQPASRSRNSVRTLSASGSSPCPAPSCGWSRSHGAWAGVRGSCTDSPLVRWSG
jgi:hypothetical protein